DDRKMNPSHHQWSGPFDLVYVKERVVVTEILDRYVKTEHSFARQTVLQAAIPGSNLEGLWVLLVSNEGELAQQDSAGRVPVMARAGNDQTYLLVFKDMAKARRFVSDSSLDGAEPRMVV